MGGEKRPFRTWWVKIWEYVFSTVLFRTHNVNSNVSWRGIIQFNNIDHYLEFINVFNSILGEILLKFAGNDTMIRNSTFFMILKWRQKDVIKQISRFFKGVIFLFKDGQLIIKLCLQHKETRYIGILRLFMVPDTKAFTFSNFNRCVWQQRNGLYWKV